MLVSPKHKLIFFKSMKCAGSSIEHAFLQACDEGALCAGGWSGKFDNLPGHVEYIQRNNDYIEDGMKKFRFHAHTHPDMFIDRIQNIDIYEDYKKVTITRNPWDVVVSWYWYDIGHIILQHHPLLILESHNEKQAKQIFKSFITNIAGHTPVAVDLWNEQQRRVQRSLDYVAMNEKFIHPWIDRYLRFESLSEDYHKCCDDLDIVPYPLKKFKSKHRKLKHHYSYYYTDETRELVAEAFPKTIKTFGYTFESRYD